MTTPTTPEQARELADQLDDRTLSGVSHPSILLRSLAKQVEKLTAEVLLKAEYCRTTSNAHDAACAERDALKVGAERYQLLAAYVVGPCTDADDQIIACKTVDQVSAVIDAMKAAS